MAASRHLALCLWRPVARFRSFKPRGPWDRLRPVTTRRFAKAERSFGQRPQASDPRPRLLIGGHNSRKIGKRVMKGKLKGFPIFTLTLEERDLSLVLRSMERLLRKRHAHWAVRIKHGREFEEALWDELADKQLKHPERLPRPPAYSRGISTRSIMPSCGAEKRLRLIRRCTSSATRRASRKARSASRLPDARRVA